jgi:hypothetical protein
MAVNDGELSVKEESLPESVSRRPQDENTTMTSPALKTDAMKGVNLFLKIPLNMSPI